MSLQDVSRANSGCRSLTWAGPDDSLILPEHSSQLAMVTSRDPCLWGSLGRLSQGLGEPRSVKGMSGPLLLCRLLRWHRRAQLGSQLPWAGSLVFLLIGRGICCLEEGGGPGDKHLSCCVPDMGSQDDPLSLAVGGALFPLSSLQVCAHGRLIVKPVLVLGKRRVFAASLSCTGLRTPRP